MYVINTVYKGFNYLFAIITIYTYIQVHLTKIEYGEKVLFLCNLFQKVKLSYILDSLHVQ